MAVCLKPVTSVHITGNQLERFGSLCKIQMLPFAKIFAKLELFLPFKFCLFLGPKAHQIKQHNGLIFQGQKVSWILSGGLLEVKPPQLSVYAQYTQQANTKHIYTLCIYTYTHSQLHRSTDRKHRAHANTTPTASSCFPLLLIRLKVHYWET